MDIWGKSISAEGTWKARAKQRVMHIKTEC